MPSTLSQANLREMQAILRSSNCIMSIQPYSVLPSLISQAHDLSLVDTAIRAGLKGQESDSHPYFIAVVEVFVSAGDALAICDLVWLDTTIERVAITFSRAKGSEFDFEQLILIPNDANAETLLAMSGSG